MLQKLGLIESKKENIILGLGAKYPKNMQYFDVDYIFSFDIDSKESKTSILYNIAVINVDLIHIFKSLANQDNKLQGKIQLDAIYKIFYI